MHSLEHAAGPATAPRHNMYGFIHKAMRAFMADTLVRIGRLDANDPVDVEAGLDQLRELLDLCRHHLAHENRFVHPAMEARAPGSSSQVAGEHVHHEADIDALDEMADALVMAPAGAARTVAANRLYRQLAVFIGINFEHMEHEEHEHNAVLWKHYSDAELFGIEAGLQAALSPAERAQGLRLMLGALDHGERVKLLGGMRAHAPAAVFEGALALARSLLAERDWQKLERALQPAVAAA
ncbi:MAG: hemerythrin domain-containing protein [Pseudomonadota bacterium]